jgi:hypothetical protein
MIKIQLGNPEILLINEHESTSLIDVLESIFPLETDNLVLVWNNIPIQLNYKYDIAIMIWDFVDIVKFIQSDSDSELVIYWPSNTFASLWRLTKENRVMNIETKWDVVNGNIEKILNSVSENRIEINKLDKEIKKLLFFLYKSLKKSGIDCNVIDDFDELVSCLS